MTNANPAEERAFWSPETDGGFVYFDERMMECAEDLNKSFELRYRVYCEEMGFLPATDYPQGIETDAYDKHSLHFGSFNKEGAIVGTVRLVRGSGIEALPMHDHCSLYAEERTRLGEIPKLVELSRLAVSRQYRRRAGDGLYGLSGMPHAPGMQPDPVERRQIAFPTVLRLYRVMYHVLKEEGIKDIVASMETTLLRIMRALHFPIRQVGPEVDYYGPVRPFHTNLDELEARLWKHHPDILQYFNYGLEPEFQCGLLLQLPLRKIA